MAVDATSSTTASPSTAQNTAAAKQRIDKQYGDFLKLLTTQLQNQDPTQPLDTNQLTQQIATLTQVEQQVNTNTLLEKLVAMLTTGQINDAVSYIGRQVDAKGNQVQLLSGSATLVYELPAGTTEATVSITDSAGQVVFTGPGTKFAGRNQMLWQGSNSVNGQTMTDGNYSFTVKAKDAQNKEVKVTTFTSGKVLAVESKDGEAKLSLGNVTVPVKDVIAVYNPVTASGS